MRVIGNKCEITNAWDDDGNKIINHGNGFCVISSTGLLWRGKLLNGLPDGEWKFHVSDEVYGNEVFKKGKFVSGYNHNVEGESEYFEKSRINLMPTPQRLIFLNSEHLGPFNEISCDGAINYRKFGSYNIQIFD